MALENDYFFFKALQLIKLGKCQGAISLHCLLDQCFILETPALQRRNKCMNENSHKSVARHSGKHHFIDLFGHRPSHPAPFPPLSCL